MTSPGRPPARRTSSGPAEATVAAHVLLARRPQVAAVVVRPQLVLEDVLGIRRLPDEEVTSPPLPRRPDEQVHIGNVGAVQVLGERRLTDPARTDLSVDGFLREIACGF